MRPGLFTLGIHIMHTRHPLRRALLLSTFAALSGAAWAQQPAANTAPWPTKTVKIMVGFPAGTSPDLVARTLAEPLSKALGQPVIVENKPGAGGNIAADLVAKSTDGHTIGVMINGNLTIAKLLNPKTPYDPATDLAPISLIGTAPLVLAAPASAPGAGASEFLAAARQAGDKWSYGSPGVGTVGHLGMELLKARTGITPVHVPYPGYPQVVTAMMGDQIHLSMLPPGLAMAQARAGKITVLGVTSSGRSSLLPEVPSLSEYGVKNFQLEIWNAVAGPASMPPAVIAKLSALISEIVRSADVRQKLYQQGWQVAGASAEALAHRIKADTATLGKIIADQGIKAE
jgi:tripartite-type tricarboxylate transporter receptor subunit TctC